jgi:hypothetical protein
MRGAAALVGKGLLAGAAGTVAITLSQMIDQRIRGKDPSTAPAQAVEKLTPIDPDTERGEKRLNYAAHMAYGTAWGVPRALLGVTGLPSPVATGLHFAAIQGASMAMLPALDIAPPPTQWEKKEIGIEAFHHLVYAAVTGFVFERLARRG